MYKGWADLTTLNTVSPGPLRGGGGGQQGQLPRGPKRFDHCYIDELTQ